jgi:transcriptional accessory protein Tex/SPT6
MSADFVDDPAKIVSIGQKVKVKVYEIDDRGRINLTMLLDETGPNKDGEQRPPRTFNNNRRPPQREQGFPSRFMPQSRFRR